MVTIKHIGEVCGVSAATVSKALNHASDIGAETAERIRNKAREMGYFPNAAARSLKTRRSNNLGVVFFDGTSSGLLHEYFSAILNSFKVEAERSGYDVTFLSFNIGDRAMSYLEHCRYRGCDGVMIATADFSDPAVIELAASSIPVVTIDYLYDNCGAILSDNEQCMRDLVQYVYDRGHRKIAFIHGEDTAVTRLRLAAFYKSCEQLGLSIPDDYVVTATYHDPPASGLATRKLLALSDAPTCILYPDDFSYIGGINEIERQNLRVPENISAAGFDGIYLGQVLRPKLTTLKQDSDAIGAQAARMLIGAIESPKTYIPRRVVIPGIVWAGDTVAQL